MNWDSLGGTIFLMVAGLGILVFALWLLSYSTHNGPVAVVDAQGMCWIGNKGKAAKTGAVVETNGGTVFFHSPSVVYEHQEHVSEKTISQVLRVNTCGTYLQCTPWPSSGVKPDV